MGKDKKPSKRPTLQELMRRLTWWAAHNPRDAARALDVQEKQARQEAEPDGAPIGSAGSATGFTESALSAETLATLQAVGRATVTPDIQHTLALAVFNLLVLQARALPGGSLYDRWATLNYDALADVLRASPQTVTRAVRALYKLGFIELRPARDGVGRDVRIARAPDDAAQGGIS